jgi:hypothetical protein
MNPHNYLKCHVCGKPADVSNPTVTGTLNGRPICVACIVRLSLPVAAC